MPDYGCYIFIENQIEISGKGVPLGFPQKLGGSRRPLGFVPELAPDNLLHKVGQRR